MVYKLIRTLVGLESGRDCRACADPIEPKDLFGMSEGVCAVCRP
jgi:hypothetical protein